MDGAKLYEAYLSGDSISKAHSLYDYMNKDLNSCPFEYENYLVKDGEDNIILYFVGNLAAYDRYSYVIGKHFTVYMDLNKKKIDMALSTTDSCLTTSVHSRGLKNPVVYFEDMQSVVPNVFHVFFSKRHRFDIAIFDDTGLWLIEKGKISLIRRKSDFPRYERSKNIQAVLIEALEKSQSSIWGNPVEP